MPISFYFVKYYSLNVRPKLNSPVTSRDEPSSSPKRGRWQQLRYDVLNYISPLLFSFEIYRVITLELRCIHEGCNLIALGVELGGELGKGVEVSIFEINLLILHFQRGYSPKIYTGGSAPRSNPSPTYLYIIFDGKGTTFVYLLSTNGTPFTYL